MIEAQVREWCEQILVEVVLAARNSTWSAEQLDALLSPTSFTAALLPRHLLHATLQKRLAQKLGPATHPSEPAFGGGVLSALATALLAELDDDALDALAEALFPRLAAKFGGHEGSDPWLSTEDAARHLACSRDRLYDLVQLGKLKPRRDGRRLLFKLADLDAYLEN